MARRRGSGEGSVYQRSDGYWTGSVDLGWQNGKRRRKVVYARTRREAVAKVSALTRAQQSGEVLHSRRERLETYLERWITEVLPSRVRPSTAQSYAMNLRRHVIPCLGRITVEQLTPADVDQFLRSKIAEGLSPRTVGYIHAILRTAMQHAVRLDVVPRNVVRLVPPPTARRPQVQPLTVEEATKLLNAARGDRLEALYGVALALGLRRGEALALRWEDVDLDRATLSVKRTLVRLHGELIFNDPKTAKSTRTIPLPMTLVTALKAHRSRQVQERLAAGTRWRDHGLVFTSTIGTPIEPRNLTRAFHRLCETAGLRRCRLHDLRHTCASLLLTQGVPARVVMEILGHSGIAITLDTYTHVMPSTQKSALDGMNELFALP